MSILVRNATRRFGDFTALDDVSVEIPSGSLTALLGPSGSGKSTLLRVIAGLERPDGGSVEIDGRDATRLPPQRRGVGFVFQHYAAFKHMTVRENVAFGLKVARRPKAEIRRPGLRAAGAGPAPRPGRPLPGPALGRPAPAHGPGPLPGRPAERAAAGRAVRGPGRPGPQGAAGLAAPPPRRGPRDHGVRHPRPGGGHGGGRPDRGHEPRPGRAGGRPPRPVRAPGQRLRDGLRRPGHPAGRALRPPPRRRGAAPAQRHHLRGHGGAPGPPRLRGPGRAGAAATASASGPSCRARTPRSWSWPRARSCSSVPAAPASSPRSRRAEGLVGSRRMA